jgi:hypothetical protein
VQLVDFLERAGHDRIYLIDNDSAYPPLLEYFERSPHEVIRLGRNVGHLSAWDLNLFGELGVNGRFVFTDPDVVPGADCPLDAVTYFGEILDLFPDLHKVGFGLRIDNIPDGYRFKRQTVLWESQFWERQLAPRLYDAWIDTIFALHREPGPHSFFRAARTRFPYVARHVPWYLDDHALPEDEAFYRGRADQDEVMVSRKTLNPVFVEAITAREAALNSSRSSPDKAVALAGNDLLKAGGLFLASPPGAVIGVKGSQRTEELQLRLQEAEAQLDALRSTKTFRYSAPARRVYGRLRR